MEGSHTRTQCGGACMQVKNRRVALGQVAKVRSEDSFGMKQTDSPATSV